MKIVLLSSLVLGLILVFGLVLWFTNQRVVVARYCQPADISYQSFDPYCVYLLSKRLNLDASYQILLGVTAPEGAYPGYGYKAQLEVTQVVSSAELASSLQVEWTPTGVNVSSPAIKELSVPKTAFTGGR